MRLQEVNELRDSVYRGPDGVLVKGILLQRSARRVTLLTKHLTPSSPVLGGPEVLVDEGPRLGVRPTLP
jgi:hypothetical protein